MMMTMMMIILMKINTIVITMIICFIIVILSLYIHRWFIDVYAYIHSMYVFKDDDKDDHACYNRQHDEPKQHNRNMMTVNILIITIIITTIVFFIFIFITMSSPLSRFLAMHKSVATVACSSVTGPSSATPLGIFDAFVQFIFLGFIYTWCCAINEKIK